MLSAMPATTGRPVTFYLKEEEWQTLKEAAQRNGMSMPLMAKKLIFNTLENERLTSDEKQSSISQQPVAESSPAASILKDLQDKNEQLSTELARLERDVASVMREVKFLRNGLARPKIAKPK